MTQKTCTKCLLDKPAEAFAGRRAHCRDCYNIIRRGYYAKPEVRAMKQEKRKAYEARGEVKARHHELRSRPETRTKERAASKAWKQVNQDQVKAYRLERNAKPSVRADAIYASALLRAKQKRLPFNLTREWVRERVLKGHCELSGIAFSFERQAGPWRRDPLTPSIDQIIAGAGYTTDNCRVVLNILNLAMCDYGFDTYREIAIKCLENHGFAVTRPRFAVVEKIASAEVAI